MASRTPPARDYTKRRGEISAYGRTLVSSQRLNLIIILVGVVLSALLAFMIIFTWAHLHPGLILLASVSILVLCMGLWLIHSYARQHFVEPNLAIQMWLQQVCDGELDARIGLASDHPHHKEVNFHTMNLAASLGQLSNDMDELVESQTKRLNDQKRVLELLFKITADVASESEDEAAFGTVCQDLADWFDSACVTCYRVERGESDLHCVATRAAATQGVATITQEPECIPMKVEQIPTRITQLDNADSGVATQSLVPFFAGDDPAGLVTIEKNNESMSERIESRRVLSTVSEQLSLLCSKQLVQEQMLQARLNHDRNELAAEIHDSLAQTLLAVRYQATLLGEKLKSHSEVDAYNDVLKITGSIEEANAEIRGLIRQNRSPLTEHRYADSLQMTIDQFSQTSGIAVFFQSDDPHIQFTPREESVLQRIIGEALNNARKYAQAKMIRVYLQRSASGVRRVLVEDDGIGFQQPSIQDTSTPATQDAGEHIGLAIMRDRALSIGAKLSIDTELGEGSRIAITMPPLIEPRRKSE